MIAKPDAIYIDARRRNRTVNMSVPKLKRRTVVSRETSSICGFHLYFALLCFTFTSTSTTATEEINPSCASDPPFTRDHGGNKPFSVPFKSLVVFGDSYSDTGNIEWASNHTAFNSTRSWNGRYADGPVWVDYFATYFGLPELVSKNAEQSAVVAPIITNFAYGGATTNNSYIKAESTFFADGDVPAVDIQVKMYLADRLTVDDNVLHVLFSGYNDYWYYVYRNYTTAAGQDEGLDLVALTVVRSIVNNMHELYGSGARNFMVMKMHDMTKLPEAINHSKEVKDAYTYLIHRHNHYLEEYVNAFNEKTDDTTVYLPSAYNSMECIEKERNSLGFYDTQNAFYGGVDVVYPVFTYRWWDAYHPTTHTHHYLSTSAIQAVFDQHQIVDDSDRGSSATAKKVATKLWFLLLVLSVVAV